MLHPTERTRRPSAQRGPFGVLLDIDGVLYVGDEPIEGAHQALLELRELAAGLRLMTNTTSRSRRAVLDHLLRLDFDVSLEEVLTPAAIVASSPCNTELILPIAALPQFIS